MAGHSHWANIKHKKGVNDRAKAKVLARMGKLIAIAVQLGSPKPEENPRLRLAIQKARASNMPMDAIERAIKKAAGIGVGDKPMSEVSYEGYAPGGVAIVVDALTDNRHRTAPEIKKLFERAGGAIGAPGCVAWQFKDVSVFLVDCPSEDQVMEALLAADADATDIVREGDQVAITAATQQYDAIGQALGKAKLAVANSDLTKIPDNRVLVTDAGIARQINDLVAALDEHPDVQDVFTNMDGGE
ncbi:MAG: YebC/PmpR family DNA-binding transcriptional regulator [Planctomycetes bacterium]|nr:YebC/PmpR family DNA-binding transcriptional regulator [Planctomycetota bacterium]